jgi:hypothetical protein
VERHDHPHRRASPAPPATDLGSLSPPGASATNIALGAGQVKWLRFTVPAPVNVLSGAYIDIDTLGSDLPAQANSLEDDTTFGLYDAAGTLVARDDDSCDGLLSQLSFGAGTRPGIGDGVPYDGRNGPPGGVYYLGVAAYPASFGSTGWDVRSTATQTGALSIRIGTNGAACYPNCDASTQAPVLNVQDFTCFLTKFVAAEAYANCDGSTQNPILNVQDFTCFLTKYMAGCS